MRDTQLIKNGQTKLFGHGLVVHVQDGATHYYSLVVQALGCRHAHQSANLAAATRLTEYGHVIGITAKLGDIITHPFQSLDSVHHTNVTRVLVLGITGS